MKNLVYNLKNQQGFTMIELIIVIALIAIISAMIIPNFNETISRSKIKTDINGLRTLQNAVDLYEVETGDKLKDLDILVSNGYIKNKDTQFLDSQYSLLEKDNKNTYVKYMFPKSADVKYKKYIASIKDIVKSDDGKEFSISDIASINSESILEIRLK